MSAYYELVDSLQPGEMVEAIVFGPFGWGSEPHKDGDAWEPGYQEPEPPPVPFDMRGKLLTLEQARPFMEGWSFDGGYGAPGCYAVNIWTSHRVMWVHEYDGATWLCSAPRNPTALMPSLS